MKKMTEERKQTRPSNSVSRREFITGAVGGAIAGAAVGSTLYSQGVTASTGPTESSSNSPGAEYPLKYTADVVVVGAGHGGMCAAVSAAQEGVKTILLEISQKTGGSAVFSGGYIHDMGIRTWAQYLSYEEGMHDPDLAQTYLSTFLNTFIPWLTSIGAYFQVCTEGGTSPTVGRWDTDWKMGKGEPGTEGHRLYFNSLEKAFAGFGGGPILLKTRGLKLLTDKYGDLAGVRASTWVNSPTEQNQYTFDIAAKAVVLANGCFYNNPELKNRYVGSYADRTLNLGQPYARGDGLLMAQELGAAGSGSMSTFVGTFFAITPAKQTMQDPDLFEAASAASNPNGVDYGSLVEAGTGFAPGWITSNPIIGPSYGIFVNLDGKRFVDEQSPMAFKTEARPYYTILQQRQGMAFMIADANIVATAAGSQTAMFAITQLGGTVFQGSSIQALGAAIAAAYPFYANNFVQTINNYNSAIAGNTAANLDPPRSSTTLDPKGGYYPILTAPFYAVPTTVGMIMNMGGIAVNTKAEVLDLQKTPIPGLHATFPCAGGLMNTNYSGAVASAGTFGYIAGKSAANFVKTGVVTSTTTTSTSTTT